MSLAEHHERALAATRDVVAGIEPGQLDLPTPCEGWSVRELLNHVISGNFWAGELMDGKTIEEVGDRLDGDVVGAEPLASYAESAGVAAAAFNAPGAMEKPAAVSYGPVPGEVYCGHRLLDVLVHGWDLATATGRDATLDPSLVAAAIAVVEPQLDLLRASGAFATDVDVPPDADPQTTLLAWTGRRP